MIKLTRLNRQVVAINPDLVLWVDAVPDTTLCLAGGEKILVLESLDELIERVIEFRTTVRSRVVSSAGVARDRADRERHRNSDIPRPSRIPLLRVVEAIGRDDSTDR